MSSVIILFTNSALSEILQAFPAYTVVFVLLTVASFTVTATASIALTNAKKMHGAYHDALMSMYKEHGVDKYYPAIGIESHQLRTTLLRPVAKFVLFISGYRPVRLTTDCREYPLRNRHGSVRETSHVHHATT